MGFYQYHVFVCTNQREDGRPCCEDFGAQDMRDYFKRRCKDLGLSGQGKVRINNAGCMDRCAEGPVIAVYPEAVWYTFVDKQDIDEIITSHLRHGTPVERLRLPDKES